MAYIYQIINDINNKIYIGKTEFSIEKRFKEHCRDAMKECENRPLYAAMRKYGIEHFHISLIEKTNQPEEREKYWIEQKRSFKSGYNATRGGDGSKYLDYDILIEAYKQLQSLTKVAELYHCDIDHLSHILKENNISVLSSQEVNLRDNGKLVNQYDKTGQYIQTHAGIKAAARAIGKNGGASHIVDVCKGRRKTAYGFIWKYTKQCN